MAGPFQEHAQHKHSLHKTIAWSLHKTIAWIQCSWSLGGRLCMRAQTRTPKGGAAAEQDRQLHDDPAPSAGATPRSVQSGRCRAKRPWPAARATTKAQLLAGKYTYLTAA